MRKIALIVAWLIPVVLGLWVKHREETWEARTQTKTREVQVFEVTVERIR